MTGALPLLLAACAWVDPEDCRQVGEGCATYLPEGLVCGLVHAGVPGHPGSACRGYDPAYDRQGGLAQEDSCPPGFQVAGVGDADAEDDWVFCMAEGNAAESSGDLAEVPRDAVCGLNTVWGRGTEHLCMGADPTRGECPQGFELAYGLEFSAGGNNLVVWCQVSEGCVGDCPADGAEPICGLSMDPAVELSAQTVSTWLDTFDDEALSPELRALIEDDLIDGEVGGGDCRGLDPHQEGCPEGLERYCLPDFLQLDEGTLSFDYCWCGAPGEGREVVGVN